MGLGIDDLLKEKRDEILRLAAKYGATNVRVFGSVARGQAGSDSDVDILVEFESKRSLLDHIGLSQDLEDLLGRKIDVLTEKSLHWYIRDKVISEATPL
jgi:hypothetical protein